MTIFTDLPFELLRLIIIDLDYYSLRSFSLINRRYRSVSTSDIFHTFKVEFTEKGIKKLKELAISSLN
ncbi:F-box domain, cyclin-like [Penicillium roqueforti FM164]|uniref:F-box domain, cyclin-like n=1 Tax=Penicillium roqueforti (strain FM164) TaxID=1365484 RepID=W6QFM1_PENRF|nr:F-box domain, cyclin-like [Penicillium roqueforti FM164]